MREREFNEASWHLDKKVPVALIVTLFVQAAFGIWWASKLSFQVNDIAQDIIYLKNAQVRTAEKIELHAQAGAHGTAEHRLQALESQMRVLLSLSRLGSMRGNFAQTPENRSANTLSPTEDSRPADNLRTRSPDHQ